MLEHVTSAKIGCLLMNIGTPSEPTVSGLRTYLKEFLSDPDVVDTNAGLPPAVENESLLYDAGRDQPVYNKNNMDVYPLNCKNYQRAKWTFPNLYAYYILKKNFKDCGSTLNENDLYGIHHNTVSYSHEL